MRRFWLIALASASLLAAGPPSSAPLRDVLWTDANADVAKRLTEGPGECLINPKNEPDRLAVRMGRVLFRSPGILGGPAARLGLSCNACHPDGRTNTAFFLPELTDRPGAADVTAEWASAVRGDGIMNPVPIPDLTDVGTRKALGHNKEPSLERFVERVVTEEFQGNPLPSPAKEGLIAYLRALKSKGCTQPSGTPLTLESAAKEVEDAVMAADQKDLPTAQLLLLAAQEAMGRIAERLPADRFENERQRLEALSREVGRGRASPALFFTSENGRDWDNRFYALVYELQKRETETYFNAAALRAALKGQ